MKFRIGDRVKYKDDSTFHANGEGTLAQIGTISDCCYVQWDGSSYKSHEKLRDLTWLSIEQVIYNHDFLERIEDRLE